MSVSSATTTTNGENALKRAIDWRGAFWVASGVPALVVFSIGGIAGTVGIPAYAVWIVSMIMGFIQSFTYAEIAGLFPNKSGGASVFGAAAWLKYRKWIAPLSVWCNWLAWTPVLSLGCSIAAANRTEKPIFKDVPLFSPPGLVTRLLAESSLFPATRRRFFPRSAAELAAP